MEGLRGSDIENLDKAFESLDLKTHNVKMDIFKTSNLVHRKRFGEGYKRRYGTLETKTSTAATYNAIEQEKNTPMEIFRPEGINPFGIYLDLGNNPNISSTLDRWKTSIRLALIVNKMDIGDANIYIEMSMLKSILSYWNNLQQSLKNTALEGDNINIVISKVGHLIRLEFLGE